MHDWGDTLFVANDLCSWLTLVILIGECATSQNLRLAGGSSLPRSTTLPARALEVAGVSGNISLQLGEVSTIVFAGKTVWWDFRKWFARMLRRVEGTSLACQPRFGSIGSLLERS